MIISYPIPMAHADPTRREGRPPSSKPPPPAAVDGSWRYEGRTHSRRLLILAALISASLHAAILFGIGPPKKKPAPKVADTAVAIMLTMPDLKELEEPEVVYSDETPPTDMSTLVPMQADLPQVSRPTDFVQQINFTSLLERPDFSKMDISVVPQSFHGGRQLAESIGKIFNLADLDRIPEPVLQPAPIYPAALKREGATGRVLVRFVVNTEGRVLNAHAIESNNAGFEDAAVAAVSKWKFRPGIKGGKKVNTLMGVPVIFTIEGDLE